MRSKILLISAGLLASMAVNAAEVYRCEIAGEVTFSDTQCEAGNTRTEEYNAPRSGWNGRSIMEDNWMLLQDYERRKNRQRSAKQYTRPAHLGWSARQKIRSLEMEKKQAQDRLRNVGSRGAGNWGKARAIAEEIRGYNQRIRDLERGR